MRFLRVLGFTVIAILALISIGSEWYYRCGRYETVEIGSKRVMAYNTLLNSAHDAASDPASRAAYDWIRSRCDLAIPRTGGRFSLYEEPTAKIGIVPVFISDKARGNPWAEYVASVGNNGSSHQGSRLIIILPDRKGKYHGDVLLREMIKLYSAEHSKRSVR